MLSNKNIRLLALGMTLIATPVIAGDGNFQKLILARGSGQETAVVTGTTSGNFSLSTIANMSTIPNIKGEKKPCIGYASPTPDHVMELTEKLPQLKLKVNSNGGDTTIVIRGPKPTDIRCEFGTTSNPDAVFEGNDWAKGKYEIWIGRIEAGRASDYSLSASGGITRQ